MSGGPVFDRHGNVFGIVTSSMMVDGEWDTYVSLPWSAFMFEAQPEWPAGLYRQPSTLWPGHVAENWRLSVCFTLLRDLSLSGLSREQRRGGRS